ncbi:MAG: hypothetical protein RLZZ423_369 [Cyanobacteriota bacterium]|jgi:hypothetical protein
MDMLQQTGAWEGMGVSGASLLHSSGPETDSVSSYFECITACSLDDGECVTRCVEVLREQL